MCIKSFLHRKDLILMFLKALILSCAILCAQTHASNQPLNFNIEPDQSFINKQRSVYLKAQNTNIRSNLFGFGLCTDMTFGIHSNQGDVTQAHDAPIATIGVSYNGKKNTMRIIWKDMLTLTDTQGKEALQTCLGIFRARGRAHIPFENFTLFTWEDRAFFQELGFKENHIARLFPQMCLDSDKPSSILECPRYVQSGTPEPKQAPVAAKQTKTFLFEEEACYATGQSVYFKVNSVKQGRLDSTACAAYNLDPDVMPLLENVNFNVYAYNLASKKMHYNDKCIGSVYIRIDENLKLLDITILDVFQQYQKKGYGTAVVLGMVDLARHINTQHKSGIQKISGVVDVQANEKFYQKLKTLGAISVNSNTQADIKRRVYSTLGLETATFQMLEYNI